MLEREHSNTNQNKTKPTIKNNPISDCNTPVPHKCAVAYP
jgi:hypothetical protein